MKKTLLTLGLAVLALASSAQETFVIWDGTNDAAAKSVPSKLGDAIINRDTLAFEGDSLFYLNVTATSAGYYAGGVGVATFATPGVATTLEYSGSVATTTVKYKISTLGSPSPVSIRLDFKTSTGLTYGFEKTFTTNSISFDQVSIPLAQFKLVNTSNGTFSTAIDDEVLALFTSEVQFNASTKANTGNGDISFSVADLVLESSVPLAIENNFLSSTKDEVVSVYNIMGAFVATGKLADLNLEAGKLYVVKAGNTTRKIVMN